MIRSKLLAFGQKPYVSWPCHILYALCYGQAVGSAWIQNYTPRSDNVYGNSISKGETDWIQELQIFPVCFIINLWRHDHESNHRKAINMLPMEDMCRLLTSMIHTKSYPSTNLLIWVKGCSYFNKKFLKVVAKIRQKHFSPVLQ